MSEDGSFFHRWSERKKHASHPDIDDVPPSPSPLVEQPIDSIQKSDSDQADPDQLHSESLCDAALPSTSNPASAHPGSHNPADDSNKVTETQPTEEPLLSDNDMPPIESLDARSDLTGFFNRGVSPGLRRAALRHVFQLPSYNVRDVLNDYDDDFTTFEPLGDTVTADMKFHAARKERDRLEKERLELEQLEQERLASENEAFENDSDRPLQTLDEDGDISRNELSESAETAEELQPPQTVQNSGRRDVKATDPKPRGIDTTTDLADTSDDSEPSIQA